VKMSFVIWWCGRLSLPKTPAGHAKPVRCPKSALVDTNTNEVVHTVLAIYPVGVAISPDGSAAYIVSEYSNTTLYTLSTSTYKFTAKLALGEFGALGPTTAGIAITPDGKNIFVDDSADGVVWKVDAVPTARDCVLVSRDVPSQSGCQ
jgi:DNA-binding beta-propeller fold protein YncE